MKTNRGEPNIISELSSSYITLNKSTSRYKYIDQIKELLDLLIDQIGIKLDLYKLYLLIGFPISI